LILLLSPTGWLNPVHWLIYPDYAGEVARAPGIHSLADWSHGDLAVKFSPAMPKACSDLAELATNETAPLTVLSGP
jgi:hypothetical protein